MNKKWILIICLVVIILIWIGYYLYSLADYSESANTISEKELRCGAYYGFHDQKKIGTPDDWVWHEGGKSSVWSAPNGSISCLYAN